jgi:dihydroxy-acid dehydratase
MSETSTSYWNDIREGLRVVELRAAGFDPADAAKRNAVVTIASPYTNAHRCNNRVRRIADLLVEMISQRGGQGLLVGTPAVSDALTQGTANAGYSLVSRELMADCIETGHYAHHAQAMIVISGCDKSGAAALMPLARTNAFGLVVIRGPARQAASISGPGPPRATTSPSWTTSKARPDVTPVASATTSSRASTSASCPAAVAAARCSRRTR